MWLGLDRDILKHVDVYHAKKMAARLQAATSSDGPILLRVESGAHSVGQSLDQEIGIETDVLAFVTNRLGVDTTD